MRKSKKIIAVVAILAIILLAFVGGQTYAKYITEVKGDGMAEVASWSFRVDGSKTVNEIIHLISTAEGDDVLGGKIAPGTSGSFNINVDARGSEVGIDYNIGIKDGTGKPTNLKFTYGGKMFSTTEELKSIVSGTIDANAPEEEKLKTITIGWIWEYETGSDANTISANDQLDTKEAEVMTNYMFTVSVTGTQVNPNATTQQG